MAQQVGADGATLEETDHRIRKVRNTVGVIHVALGVSGLPVRFDVCARFEIGWRFTSAEEMFEFGASVEAVDAVIEVVSGLLRFGAELEA